MNIQIIKNKKNKGTVCLFDIFGIGADKLLLDYLNAYEQKVKEIELLLDSDVEKIYNDFIKKRYK